MATNRLEILKQLLTQDPNNTFAQYGLAMEYANSGQYAEAASEFRALLNKDESYVAAYFHGGQTLEKLGKIEEARELYKKGIEASAKKGDSHTRAEIEAALDLLPI
jgi:tetratricopeptide (TPR) repeat protein